MNKTKNAGITLVALVVTIIILLILAGITISQLTGSGLFENARLAEEKSKNAQEKEEEILADYENKIGKYVEASREEERVGIVSRKEFTIDGARGQQNYTYTYDFSNVNEKEKLTERNFVVIHDSFATFCYSNNGVLASFTIKKVMMLIQDF